MRILSVVGIEVFSLYGYDYMKKIVLRRADLKEHIIAERDFKYLYPSDFEDLYLLNLQGHLNHLQPKDKKILTTAVNLWTRNLVIRQRVEDFQLGIESYQTQLNLIKPRWDATGFEYKHEFIVIESPRAVTFRDKYGIQMIMRFNEIHKFSDGTLHQIDEALDYRVNEFKVNKMNPGLNTRFWTRKDVERSKEFMFAILKRLKTRRIFRNLESFVGRRTTFSPKFSIIFKSIEILNLKGFEIFDEAWEQFKELLRACPHHEFTELTVDTFYNGLNENEQDSLNVAARSNAFRMNATSSKTDERIDKLADQLLTLVEIGFLRKFHSSLRLRRLRNLVLLVVVPILGSGTRNEETTDKEQTISRKYAQIPPPVIPISILEPDVPTTLPKTTPILESDIPKNLPKPNILYPS
ncbi:hypothetical protein Tco_0578349 [Tanacetum coccineum]